MDQNIKSELTDDGILIARIDMPGRSMNVFSLDMMDSLERLLQHVEGNASIRAVVLTSGKQAFLAGADLDMIRMFTERARTDSHDQLHDLCGRLGRLFRRLEKSTKPYVAAINGLALGGGLEVSLSCHARVVSDDKGVMLGLPEIKLGLLPGAGGTQRLPRMVGTSEGLRLLLTGVPMTPQQALDLGVVNRVVPPGKLLDAALECARTLGSSAAPWDKPGATFDSKPFDFTKDDAHKQIASALGLSDHLLQKYPAYKAIMDCVVGGWEMPMDEAGKWEMDCFVCLIQDPVAGNMVRTLFLNRQRAAKIAPSLLTGKDIQVAVIGENSARIIKLLERAKAPLVSKDDVLESGTELLITAPQTEHGIRLLWQEGCSFITPNGDVDGIVWLSEVTPQGQAFEVCVPTSSVLTTDAGIILAQWLRACVLVTVGRQALLPKLLATQAVARRLHCSESDELLAVSLTAARAWSEGGVPDTELADVAAIIADLHPAYTGGPYNHLLSFDAATLHGKIAEAAKRNPELFIMPARLDELLQGALPPGREASSKVV